MAVALRTLERSDLPLIRRLLGVACALGDAVRVSEELLFGAAPGVLARPTAFGAFSKDAEGALAEALGVVVISGKWLRILAVRPEMRGRGVGTSLLAMAESAIAAAGYSVARTLDQPGNYLSPGVRADDTNTIGWLQRRGYATVGTNTNLLISLQDNAKLTSERSAALDEKANTAGYTVARANRRELGEVAGIVGDNFSTSWAYEVERAFGCDPPAVHVARAVGDDLTIRGTLAAFAVHDGNNRGLGWFGPAGTLPAHRGRGLGAALLLRCLLDVRRAGHAMGVIAWIGPREFYERAVGIVGQREYVVLQRCLADETVVSPAISDPEE